MDLPPELPPDLPPDVAARLAREHPADADRARAMELARAWRIAGREGDRVLRCAIHAARGDLDRLAAQLERARIDYRDVIVEGEYDVVDGALIRKRDFNLPF